MADNEMMTVSGDRREALAARLWRAAEMQAAEVEARIAAGPRPAADSERDAKTLSVLARTLRELQAADQPRRMDGDDEQDEDAPPADVEALRTELGERLRAIAETRAAEFASHFRQAAE
jgi:hypothetical protein